MFLNTKLLGSCCHNCVMLNLFIDKDFLVLLKKSEDFSGIYYGIFTKADMHSFKNEIYGLDIRLYLSILLTL